MGDIICSSKSERDKIIKKFTKKMYSLQFKQTDIPLFGDTSWIANKEEFESDSYSIMFLKANVFVRIYIDLKRQSIHELRSISNSIENKIESKILSELR